jgi:hypothetical protein
MSSEAITQMLKRRKIYTHSIILALFTPTRLSLAEDDDARAPDIRAGGGRPINLSSLHCS